VNQISFFPTFERWQNVARGAVQQGLAPMEISWEEIGEDQPGLQLFDEAEPVVSQMPSGEIRVPKRYLPLARLVALHRDPSRWALLYRLLWRLTHGAPHLLEIAVDSDVAQAAAFEKSVRHDIHKMRAFVRFREVSLGDEPWFVAWFEPEHHIVEHNAPFFADRFASMRWSILTPERCAHWDGRALSFTPAVPRSEAPRNDKVEDLWRTYYANIFNPARVKVHAMQAEMPKKYWRNLPEATLIPSLLRDAPARVETMMKKSGAKKSSDSWHPAPVPATSSLTELREAALACTACPLYKNATQTVFGEGPKRARLMFLGEQPGDQEDLSGKPFVGPAGQLLSARSRKPASTATRFTSPTRSNISNGNRAGNGAFIKSRARATSPPAVRGLKRNCDSLGQTCSSVSAPLPRRQFLALPFGSRASAEKFYPRI